MKSHEKNFGQSSSRENHQDAKTLRPHKTENISNTKKGRKKVHEAVATYEEGDLRGIVAKGEDESTDPYRTLLESGVIKNAAEFFERGDR